MASLASLLLGLASVSHAQPSKLRDLVKQLEAPGRERSDAYMELRRRNDARVIPLLVEAMPTLDLGAQSLAVYLLEMFRNDASQQALATFTRSGPARLRVQCAVSLVQQGRKEFLAVVLDVLRDEALDDDVRAQVLPYLSRVPAQELARIVRTWLDPLRSPQVLRGAIGLVVTSRDALARQALEHVVDSEGVARSVRALASAALCALGARERESVLVAALRDDAIESQDWFRLSQALQASDRLSEPVLEACTARLEDATDVTGTRALFQIVTHFRHRGAIPAARRLMAHDDAQIARDAMAFLLTWPGALQASALRPLLSKDDPEAVLRAAEALIRMDDASGFTPVSKLATTRDNPQRVAALRLLGRFRQRLAIPILLDALEDPDLAVRTAGEQALQSLLRSLFPYRRLDVGSTGYTANGSPADRSRGVAALRVFWEAHR